MRVAAEGAFAGTILDAGCGAGDNALHIASLGLDVLGVDVADTALSMAREKAASRGLDAEFLLADGLHLDGLDRAFEPVLDRGLFHTFGDGSGWHVVSVSPDRVETRFDPPSVAAWLGRIRRN